MEVDEGLQEAALAIFKTSDIQEQRDYFFDLSTYLINAVKTYGINQKVYVDFCPMVNNDMGVHWLSDEYGILNPYYGDSMLTYGCLEEEIIYRYLPKHLLILENARIATNAILALSKLYKEIIDRKSAQYPGNIYKCELKQVSLIQFSISKSYK